MSISSAGDETGPRVSNGIVDCSVDFRGKPSVRSSSGGWRSAYFIMGAEVFERFAYFGISSNLITYFTGPLEESTAAAANLWLGTAAFLPLFWGFIADTFLGRFRTILLTSSIYILNVKVTVFFCALYLVAIESELGFRIRDSMVSHDVHSSLGFSTGGEGRKRDNPLARIGCIFVAAAKNRQDHNTPSETLCLLPIESSKKFRFLDRAMITCNSADVEDTKNILSLVQIWLCCLGFGIVYAQSSTFFTKQGSTMDRSISPNILVPAATLQCFISLAILIFIPIYDRIFVPIARSITHKPAGITMLQRISIGLFLSIVSMVIAALVEMKRLKTARDHGLVDSPQSIVPMSICWLIPQYVVYGVSDVFTVVGLQEFFYGQVPVELRSLGLSMYLSVLGLGNFLSSFMVSVIEKATSQSGEVNWFDNNLHKAHLDYFYWLLALFSSIAFLFFVYFAKSYVYTNPK
ncbi:hypothetical protein CARUB_v10025090mg [Capsella rubella]|uniref:Major facilitator superfamily (MFS) profile domain-containing protein n=1 Tax=Capsella rubella TaxID=81985 RepID=R0G0V9_9BRAS|nr:hypothetical protein CARUB_v10025090mg [Capsella rubella]